MSFPKIHAGLYLDSLTKMSSSSFDKSSNQRYGLDLRSARMKWEDKFPQNPIMISFDLSRRFFPLTDGVGERVSFSKLGAAEVPS